MTKQPEALEIADLLKKQAEEIANAGHNGWGNGMRCAETELRRLHEVNAELLGLVKLVYGTFSGGRVMTFARAIEATLKVKNT